MAGCRVSGGILKSTRSLVAQASSPVTVCRVREAHGSSRSRSAPFERELFEDAAAPSRSRNTRQTRPSSYPGIPKHGQGPKHIRQPSTRTAPHHASVELNELKNALRLDGPSSSAHGDQGNALAVARSAQAVIAAGHTIQLESLLGDIFRALAPTARSGPQLRSTDHAALAGVLSHIWLRVFQLWHTRQIGPEGIDRREIGEVLAQYLIKVASSTNVNDDDAILRIRGIFADLMKRAKEARLANRLPSPFVAACVVLQQRCAGLEADELPSTALPRMHSAPDKIIAYIAKTLGIDEAEALDRYGMALQTLQTATLAQPFPASPEELNAALARMRLSRDAAGRLHLWEQYKRSVPNAKQAASALEPGTCLDPACRDAVLGAFLQTFVTSGNRPPSKLNAGMDRALQEVLDLLPRPLPRSVFHAFLARRADSEGTLGNRPTTDQIRPLDDEIPAIAAEDLDGSSHANKALENLHETWTMAGDADKDVKMYMIYMAGLGRHGDLDGIQRVWAELVTDQACKRIYAAEHGLDATKIAFPPVEALNQMISSTLLIPKAGPEVALDLFQQARAPSSAIPINITTLNIVLRHYARMADIAAMTSLFTVASEHKLAPDVVTYTTFVQGLLRARETDKAKMAIEAMLDDGIEPNERIWSMLVSDTAKRGDKLGLQGAEAIVAEMKNRGIRISVITWTGLISGYFRGGWEADGWATVERMVQAGQKPTLVAYNMIMREAGQRGGQAAVATDDPITLKLLRKMIHGGIEPNSDTYVILLGPLIAAKNWRAAEKVIKEMQHMGFAPEKAQLKRLVHIVRTSRERLA